MEGKLVVLNLVLTLFFLPTVTSYRQGVQGQRIIHVPNSFPLVQEGKRDFVCVDSGKVHHMKTLEMFSTSRNYLESKGIRNPFLMLACESTRQKYISLVYATNVGIIRVNLYKAQFDITVTGERILDFDLLTDRNLKCPF